MASERRSSQVMRTDLPDEYQPKISMYGLRLIVDSIHADSYQRGQQSMRTALLKWADEQLELRDGNGGYANGQRYILRTLKDKLWAAAPKKEGQ